VAEKRRGGGEVPPTSERGSMGQLSGKTGLAPTRDQGIKKKSRVHPTGPRPRRAGVNYPAPGKKETVEKKEKKTWGQTTHRESPARDTSSSTGGPQEVSRLRGVPAEKQASGRAGGEKKKSGKRVGKRSAGREPVRYRKTGAKSRWNPEGDGEGC